MKEGIFTITEKIRVEGEWTCETL